ncbi:MAG: hypothetical protein AAF004_02240 [Pseudomonadota bacterium]
MTTLRDDYDPNDVPLNSSAIHKVDSSLFELQLSDDAVAVGDTVQELQIVEEPEPAERLDDTRQDSPKKARLVLLQRFLDRIVYRLYVSRAYQVGFAVVALASLGLLFFSLHYRVDHIDDNIVAMAELGRIETTLLAVRADWSQEKMQQISDKVQNADTRRVFVDYRSLAIWLREKGVYAEQLGLEFSYVLGEGQASEIDDMLELPIDVSLRGTASVDDVYLRALEFLKRVVGTAWYVEIVEASLSGGGSGAQSVDATLRVWVHASVRAEQANVQ